VYLGDTARFPYGTKSPETVIRYARSCAQLLLCRGVKLIVVACNTASAHALAILQDELEVPVLGVIEPGARAAADATRNGRVGVIGTEGTIGSRQYETQLRVCREDLNIFCRACPLFVPLAEEGWTTGTVPEEAARAYLQPLLDERIDTLLLGCTHYPILANTIQRIVGKDVVIVDSAVSTASEVELLVDAMDAKGEPLGSEPAHTFLVSDSPERFVRVGSRLLGDAIGQVEWIDF
jgi:glutamate racemase